MDENGLIALFKASGTPALAASHFEHCLRMALGCKEVHIEQVRKEAAALAVALYTPTPPLGHAAETADTFHKAAAAAEEAPAEQAEPSQ